MWSQLGSNLGSKFLPKSSQVCSKTDSKLDQHDDRFFVWFWEDSGTVLGHKLLSKLFRNWRNMRTKFFLDIWSVWKHFLVNFPSKLKGRGAIKHWKSFFSLHFGYFGQHVCIKHIHAQWKIQYYSLSKVWNNQHNCSTLDIAQLSTVWVAIFYTSGKTCWRTRRAGQATCCW